MSITFLDCTLRDGGYYNSWDFSHEAIQAYLGAMEAAGVDVVELGFRSLKNHQFAGACAYTTDDFIRSLGVSERLAIGVMVNAAEIAVDNQEKVLAALFPEPAGKSPVQLVRIACHAKEVDLAMKAVDWLKCQGFKVGINLMQIADMDAKKIAALAKKIFQHQPEVIYFADSMGGLRPEQTSAIIRSIQSEWPGAIGIHTHDNLGLALSNTLKGLEDGITWVDSTVTGMGRGPGNAQTEELAIEVAERRQSIINMVPLMSVVRKIFRPMQQHHNWGKNPYYYLAGKYGIHPTYIQEMLVDSRYGDEDIMAVIEHLRREGGKRFNPDTLDGARHFYLGEPIGTWNPKALIQGRETLILGTGPGVKRHRTALENFIRQRKPLVIALNTQTSVSSELIDIRVACHPIRLLADCHELVRQPQPIVMPYSMLPAHLKNQLLGCDVLDYGIMVDPGVFAPNDHHAVVPAPLVFAYALAIASAGEASNLYLAGFDGYENDEKRNLEVEKVLDAFHNSPLFQQTMAITPTRHNLAECSVYGLSGNG